MDEKSVKTPTSFFIMLLLCKNSYKKRYPVLFNYFNKIVHNSKHLNKSHFRISSSENYKTILGNLTHEFISSYLVQLKSTFFDLYVTSNFWNTLIDFVNLKSYQKLKEVTTNYIKS